MTPNAAGYFLDGSHRREVPAGLLSFPSLCLGGAIMSWRIPFVKAAVLVAAAFLLTTSAVLAGDRVHAANRPITPSQPTPAPVARILSLPVTVSVVLTTSPQAAPEAAYINLRSPDGSVRRFPLEGGRDAIQAPQVVLRPGEALTIRWTPAK